MKMNRFNIFMLGMLSGVVLFIAASGIASCHGSPLIKADVPVHVDADVNAAVASLQTKIDRLESQIGDRAGGSIYNIRAGGAGAAFVLLLYMLAERIPILRRGKDIIKGKKRVPLSDWCKPIIEPENRK